MGLVYTTLNPTTKQICVETVPSFFIFPHHCSSTTHLWLSNFKRAFCKKNKTKKHTQNTQPKKYDEILIFLNILKLITQSYEFMY